MGSTHTSDRLSSCPSREHAISPYTEELSLVPTSPIRPRSFHPTATDPPHLFSTIHNIDHQGTSSDKRRIFGVFMPLCLPETHHASKHGSARRSLFSRL